TQEIFISDAAVIDGNLFVSGTPGNDNLAVDATDPLAILVLVDGAPVGSYSFSGDIQILGSDGNDPIALTGYVGSLLIGGTGDDPLIGGDGNDTLIGGIGNDSLEGGPGNDIYLFDPGWGSDIVAEASDAGDDTMDFSAVGQRLDISLSGQSI